MGAAFIKMQYIYYVVELFYNLAWFTIAKFDSPVDKAMLSSFLYVTCDMIPCKLVNAFYLVLYTFVCKKSPCQAISAWKAHGAQRKGKMHPSNLCRNSNNNAKNFANSQECESIHILSHGVIQTFRLLFWSVRLNGDLGSLFTNRSSNTLLQQHSYWS